MAASATSAASSELSDDKAMNANALRSVGVRRAAMTWANPHQQSELSSVSAKPSILATRLWLGFTYLDSNERRGFAANTL